MVAGIGTQVFYVTTGGFDTHAAQNANAANGAYYNLMATLNDGLTAFYNDLQNQGLLEDTLVLTFSEFGRRISENGSQGTDHGAAVGDDGDGRPRQRRPVRHGAGPESRSRATRRSRTTPATSASRPTSARSTPSVIDQLAGRRLGGDPRRRLPQGRLGFI